MKTPIYAVMVVYNRQVEESPTFATLRKSAGVQTFVCDNSTADYHNAASCVKFGVRYLPMEGNRGLPFAYNRAIEKIVQENGANGIVCLFDDDTELPSDYFDALRETAEQSNADVFLPLVYDVQGLMSPCTAKGVRMHRVSDPATVTQENLYGINSGMAIRLPLFQKVQYDEAYFLDYVDFDFLRRAKAQGATLQILDCKLRQHFSATEETDKEKIKTRNEIFKKDFRRFCDHGFASRLKCEANLLYRKFFQKKGAAKEGSHA